MPFFDNPAQEEAIRTLKGPVILISAPGSGKTTTLVRRIHAIIESGVKPANILMVTFTTAAARDMKERYVQLFQTNPGITFSTIHSLCLKLLRREAWPGADKVLSGEARQTFLYDYMRSRRFGTDAWDMAIAAGNEISVVKNNFIEPHEHKPADLSPRIFREVYTAYEEWRSRGGMIDYDDMLLQAAEMLKDPQIRKKYQKQFEYVQVDEYQDVNLLQAELIGALSGGTGNLCVVGDDDQSIYGFRGCKPEIMLNFEKDHSGAKVIHMSTNYRSGGEIVRYADKLIRNNQTRFEKDFVSYRETQGFHGRVQSLRFTTKQKENEYLLKEIEKAHKAGVPYKEIAILFRTNVQAQGPVTNLSKQQIPYYTTETVKSIYDSFLFSDIMDYVALSVGIGGQRELFNVLNHPNRYFREAAFRDAEFTEKSLKQCAYRQHEGDEWWKTKKALETVETWISAFGPGILSMESSTKRLVQSLDEIGYEQYLKEYAEFRNMEETDLQDQYSVLISDALQYGTIDQWFRAAKEIAAKMREESREKDTEGIMITTMHGAKGLEWSRVFIIDADEGVTPHKKSLKDPALIEEERRLFYVAMTRAKDELQILGTGVKSRFVGELAAQTENVSNVSAEGRTHAVTSGYSGKKKAVSSGVSGGSKLDNPEQRPVGTKVKHKVFGTGTVLGYTAGTITVRFEGRGEKTLTFPGSFLMGFMWYV